jgi:Dockerin type I domain
MILSKEVRRTRQRLCLAPDFLEDRVVLSSGQGSTFAIIPGTVTTAGQVSTVSFKLDPTMFTTPKRNGDIELGIDIAAATPTSSTTAATLQPQIVSVTDASGHTIRVQHTKYDPKVAKANKLGDAQTSASLVTLKLPATGQPAVDYSVQVKGLDSTTGTYLLGFYLPGDVAGTGQVTNADLKTIKKDKGLTAESANYNFDADVNRDGVINSQDLSLAKKALGESTAVSPVVSVNLNPASNPAADRTVPFSSVNFTGNATPGATVTFLDQQGGASTSTTADAGTGDYSINVPLVTGSNTFTVTTLDAFGQSITGAITPVVYSPTSATAPTSS